MKSYAPLPNVHLASNPPSTQDVISTNPQHRQGQIRRRTLISHRSLPCIKEAARSFFSRLTVISANMGFPGQSSIREFAHNISSVFPGISFGFLQSLAEIFQNDAEAAINHIMDEEEHGRPYERETEPISLKRKRDESPPSTISEAVDSEDEQVDMAPRFVPKSPHEMAAM